jgi:hypothetical protein
MFNKRLIKPNWDKYDTEVYFDGDYVQIWIDREVFRGIMKLKEKYGLNEYPTPFIVRAFLYNAFKHKRHHLMRRVFKNLFFGGRKK